MAYALDSSKRKFHRLLESISNNGSTASLVSAKTANGSTASLAIEPTEKKRRLAALGTSRRTQPGMNSNSSPSSSVVRLANTTESPAPDTSGVRLDDISLVQKYCPRDRDQLLKRIQSFYNMSVLEWLWKPHEINEVEWAKRGWRLVGKETVSCVSCNKKLLVPYSSQREPETFIPTFDMTQEEIEDGEQFLRNLEERCRLLITGEHYDSCPWKVRGCDDSLYRVPLLFPNQELGKLRVRYIEICTMSDELPDVFEVPKDVDLLPIMDQFHVLYFKSPTSPDLPELPDVKHSVMELKDLRLYIFALALFGWTTQPNHPSVLRCELCFRRLGLWMYIPKPTEESTQSETTRHLNPDEEHLLHCPWIDKDVQSAGLSGADHIAAWEAVARAIKNAYTYKRYGNEPENITTTTGASPLMAISSLPSPSHERNRDPGENSLALKDLESVHSTMSTVDDDDNETRDKKHKERMSRLAKLKKVFDFKHKKR